MPQTNNVFPSLTIEENLEMGVYQRPKSFKARFDFVAELFPALVDRRAQRAGSLSGGERQMVAMGRALMMEPSVLLLDEPSAGLSPVMQDEVFVQTRRINRAGVSVVMVEQNARRCLQICDRGYVLDHGRNAYTGTGARAGQGPQGDRALPRHPGQGAETARAPRTTKKGPAARPGPSYVLLRSGVAAIRCCCDQLMTPETESICVVLVALRVLLDADRAGGRATGVVHVRRTAGTFVVDVLAVREQLRRTPRTRSTGCPHG